MGVFSGGEGRLGRELRNARHRPSDALVRSIEGRVRSTRPAPTRGAWRLAVPVGFTATLAVALALVGGISYAASSVERAAQTVSHVFMRAQAHEAVIVRSLSSGGDQYRPGYGWCDPNHIHTGPPGLARGHNKNGKLTPAVWRKKKFEFVITSFTLDEQAHLWISVTTGKGKKATRFLISQKNSKVGTKVHGVPRKNLGYVVLIPRRIPLRLAIPRNLLRHGKRYYIRITAFAPSCAPNHGMSRLFIPFVA